jgi:hypothetical protein
MMDIPQNVVLDAAHDLFCLSLDEHIGSRAGTPWHDWERFAAAIPRLSEPNQASKMMRLIGLAEGKLGVDLGLVMFHGKLIEDREKSRFLFYMVMTMLGHGVGIEDVYPGLLEEVGTKLGKLLREEDLPNIDDPWSDDAEYLATRLTIPKGK